MLNESILRCNTNFFKFHLSEEKLFDIIKTLKT